MSTSPQVIIASGGLVDAASPLTQHMEIPSIVFFIPDLHRLTASPPLKLHW